jgi:uncharacterized protein YcbX
MLGEELRAAPLTAGGLTGDRAYALIDDETGKVISVKRPKRWGRIFEISATTRPDGVHVQLPDAEALSIDDPALADRLSDFFGRRVSVASVVPENASFEEAWVRELKNDVNPYFDLPARTEDGDEIIDAGQFMSSQDNFFNFGAIHIVTTGTTRRLTELAPASRFDAHRFRPNIVVETDDEGFVETGWQGRAVTIGDVRFAVSFTVPRCVMTTLEQGDLPADPDVLRTISKYNSVDIGWGHSYPCVGVYADVVAGGDIEIGQPVSVE